MAAQQGCTEDKADIEPSVSAAETDRFGFILGNGINPGEGPSPVLVRHREVKWLSIISQWDDVSQRRSSKVKGQCQKGIPASLRAKCWPLLCGAMQRKRQNENLYQTLDEAPALQNWVDVIERDTDRQFPFHEMFQSKDGHGQRGLFRVLKAYTQFRPDEGYCQAQGPVAAVLLMNMPSEEAFWCLVQVSELYLPGYYSPLLEGVLFDAAMLPWVLKRACPAAHRHLQRQGVEPLMFATDWLMCLYTRHLPFNTLLRVWDLFFCYGVRVLFQVAVVLVRRVLGRGDQREECDGQMETLERLRGVKDYLKQGDEDAFIQEVCSVSLSEKDLQRRTERELENWRKERPNSTFDPRARCHGYLMAWERVKDMEDKKEKKIKKGNLSLPLLRSPSSLSPSLLRKKWKKRGSKATDDSEGSAMEFTTHAHKREKDERKHSNGSSSSTDSHQTTELDRCTEEPSISTVNPCPSQERSHCRTPLSGRVDVAESEQAQTHLHTDQQSRPSNGNSGITAAKEGPSETDRNREEQKVQTQSSHEEGEGRPQKGTTEEKSWTEKDGQAEETQEEENKQEGPEKTELDNKIQIVEDKEELIMEEKEETVIVEEKPEEDIQIVADKLEEETQAVKAEEVEEMQSVQDKQVETAEMRAAEIRPEAGMQSVKDEQEKEALVTHEPELHRLKDEQETTQQQTDQGDETHDSLDTKEGQTGADQEEGQRQERGEANAPHGQTVEVILTEEEEVTHTGITCEDDLHTPGGDQRERVEALSPSRQEEEEVVQPLEDVVEEKGEEDKEETDVSSPGQALQPQDSASSLDKTPVEDLNFDPPLQQPQSSPDAVLGAEKENLQTDVGLLPEGENQHAGSPLMDRHSEAPTATKPSDEEQDQPREEEAMTEAAEGHTERTDHETQEHMVVMEETTNSPQEKASVNTSASTSTQEICSSFSSRPQSTVDPTESPQSLTANEEDQGTETVQLSAPQLTSSTPLPETDTSKPLNTIEINPDSQFGSEEHRLSQAVNTPQTAETENHTHIVTSAEEVEHRPEGDIAKAPAEETVSEPISLSQDSPERTDSEELREEIQEEKKTENIVAEEKKENVGTEEVTGYSQSSGTESRVEKDSVADATDITPVTEPAIGATKATEAQPPPPGQVRVRRYSSSRSSYPRVLSEDIFKDPRDIPLEDTTTPPQPQSPTQSTGPLATPIPESTHSPASPAKNSSHTQGTTHTPRPPHSPSKSQTLNPADMGKLTESPQKRMGLFQRLRGGAKSSTTPKMTIPKILIQDFSEEAEDEAHLSSKERRKRRRERERREKEEEKLRKKQEKEKEKEQEKERKKPQTRGKSFQLPSSTFRAKDSTLKRSESQNVVSRRNSTPLSENYF